jgi:uncharacterized ferritin-like protein (DUF455 family)
MEIRAFAEQVLYADRLEDKLVRPAQVTDLSPGRPIATPNRPGRPEALGFGRDRIAFPHAEKLEGAKERGRVLHFFANHELLALELLALVLLRFPDAPSRFRRGLVATMFDEQRHLSAYVHRMSALGVELGELGLSDFFWTALKDTPSPLHFVAGMSLTLEQANLDFMLEYGRAFEAVSDAETASILDVVLEDEIRHVRHGRRWFERWRDPSLGEFEAYRALVQHPLTPARAKGRRFARGPRERAGLSQAFIDATLTFHASKGRPPLVYVPNFDAEDRLAGAPEHREQRRPEALIADLAPLLMYVCHGDDAILVPRPQRMAHLAHLVNAGFELAELIVGTDESAAEEALADRPPAGYAHWANVRDTPPVLFDKRWAAERFGTGQVRFEASTFEQTDSGVRLLLVAGHEEVVVKAGLSAAGRHRIWCREPPKPEAVAPLLARGAVVVEPWRDRVLDLGVLLDTRKKEPRLGTMRFLTDGRGQYKGHVLGARLSGLPEATHGALFMRKRGQAPFLAALDQKALEVAGALRAEGHLGPASLDAMLYRTPGGLELEPVVEVNPRMTMGFVAQALEKHLAPRASALWLHLSQRDAKRLGHGSFSAMAQSFERTAPLQLRSARSETKLERGVLFTTDPETSRQIVTLLVVGKDLEDADAMLGVPSILGSLGAVAP